MSDRYRVLALNLFGYGETTPWPGTSPQSLTAQAQLVLALCAHAGAPAHLIGHSFGGSVAMKAALLLGARVRSLVLLEPNPFYLLRQNGRTAAFLEAQGLRDHVKCYGSIGEWPRVAQRFADYWLGDGAWDAMPDRRKAGFVESLPPNFHEWDAVMDEQTPIAQWKAIPGPDPGRERSRDASAYPRNCRAVGKGITLHWTFRSVAEGGHMAPLTHPEAVNPTLRLLLDAAGKSRG